MRGFAYPNVEFIGSDRYQFIGCGRYRVSAQGSETGEAPAGPNVGNLAELLAAVAALVPQLSTSDARIYEQRDEQESYQGDSLAHAYFLASIHRGRRVRQPFQTLEGDLWCTGAIRLGQNRSPLLTEVEQSGFDIKLQAFLGTPNPDRVFLVPAAHLTAENTYLCHNPPEATCEPARTLTLSEWRALLRLPFPEAFSHKVVIGIHADELPLLVEILFHSPPDPEIAQWCQALTALHVQGQIPDEHYWEVLEHIVGSPVPRSIAQEELMDALATHRERLYLKSTTTAEQLSKIPLREVRTTRVHQVLVALRYALPVIQTVLGLRFVLIPPGTVHDIVMTTPYYLAETPISGADWTRILGSSLGIAQSDTSAAVDITPLEIERFVARVNAQVGATLRFVVPSERQWRFAVEAAGPLEPPPRGTLARPILKTILPSALGLYDLLGMVYQLCQQGRGRYAWYGGSYCTPASDFSPVPAPVAVPGKAFAKNPEWGFRPALESLEDKRWS